MLLSLGQLWATQSEDPASWPIMEPFVPLLLTPLARPQSVHCIGRFAFSDDQLEDVLVCLEQPRGIYTTREVALVFKYRWPSQFRFLLESDLEFVMKWLIANRQAKKYVDIKHARIVEALIHDWTSRERRSINDYMHGNFERQDTSGSPEITQIINTFKIELREAEVCIVRAIAKRVGPDIVLDILCTKLSTDLSFLDIACGLTNRYSNLVRGYRYVWMCPFTETQVETIWNRSQLAKTKTWNYIAGKTKGLPMPDFLKAFKRDVRAARADEALRLDPRCCGNETSAANLVEEVVHLFLCCVASKTILEAVITEPVMHS